MHPQPLPVVRRRGRPAGSTDRHGAALRVSAREAIRAAEALKRGFTERLSEIMRERDVSAEELALAIGASESTVLSWTRGRSTPSLWAMVAVAIALRVCLVDLLPESAHHP